MKINNLRKAAYTIIIILVIVISNLGLVYAESASDLKAEKKNIDDQIAETNSEIAGVKSQMSDALTQINRLNSQIGSYQDEISELESQLAVLNTQISEKEASIREQEQKYNEQKELLEKRLVAMYESGTTSFLDMLLSSDGLADFISKYYLISQLAEYDTELLEAIEQTRLQIEAEKAELETSKQAVETSKQTIKAKSDALGVSVNEKNKLVNTLSAEERTLEQQLAEFEKDKKEIQARLAAIAAQSSSTTITVTPSAAGYGTPIAGKTKNSITTGYYGYSGHTGVDFACSSGTPILAVKSGTVVISDALKYSNGSYKSYGEYIVIDHGDGTMTLYAHGLAGSRQVGVGQSVSIGQTIMKVGSTGNSTGPHLHFEVRIGGKPVNPTPYLP